jgi:cardiolipin synthase
MLPLFRKTLAVVVLGSPFFLIAGCGNGGSITTASQPPASDTLQFSVTTLTFPNTVAGQTSATQMLTLANNSGTTLTLSGYNVTGSSADFAYTTTCGISLTAYAACTFTIAFTPQPQTSGTLSAIVTITDNASNSPQSVTLTGTVGAGTGVTHTLYVFPASFPDTTQPDASLSALYALVNGAQSTIDMTMYELQDDTFTGYLINACGRSVTVRVILSSSEPKNNASAYSQLNNGVKNCSAVYSNTAFTNTHQKTITVDGTTTAIMSLNLQSQYYTTTRDFAMIENDPADIAAIEKTFTQDYNAGTPNGGTQGPSDLSYQPEAGTDLIWSPTTAMAAMTNIIANAQKTLLIENEELASSAGYIVSALQTACQKGVTVQLAMVNSSDYASGFSKLKTAGCDPHLYPDTTNGFYIHAKAVVADYGLSTQSVYMGSINYSNASMTQNRELGMYVTDQPSIDLLETTMTADYSGGTPY